MRERKYGSGLMNGLMLVVAGCVLIGVGLSLGGRWALGSVWPFDGETFHWDWEWDRDDESFDDGIRRVVTLDGEIPAIVTGLDVDLKAAALEIRTGSEPSWHAEDFPEGEIVIDVQGETLRVRERDWSGSFFKRGNRRPKVVLVLPPGAEADRVKIEMGAGSFSMEGVSVDDLDVESGAGSVKVSGGTADRARFSTGAGSIEIRDADMGVLDVETGAGRVVFEGDVGEKASVTTGAGSVELTLDGLEDDYYFDFVRGIGSIRIGGASFNGVGDGSHGDRSAPKRVKLETGVGSVRVDFAR